MRNLKIKYKIILSFTIVLSLFAITSVSVYYSIYHMNHTFSEVTDNILPLENIINQINSDLIQQETDVRGYIASDGEEAFLNEYSSSTADIDKQMKLMKKYYNAYPELGVIMENEACPNIAVIMKHFASQIDLVKSGSLEVAKDRLNAGKGYMDAYNHVKVKMRNEINKLTCSSSVKIDNAGNQAKQLLIVIFAVSVLISILLTVFLSRMITNRLKLCVIYLQEIAKGDLTHEPIKIRAKDELGSLGIAMNEMQASIRGIIKSIIIETERVNEASNKTNRNIDKLTLNLEEVSTTIEELSASIEETAYSTDEIKITSTEIEKAVDSIAEKAQEGALSAGDISNKAIELKTKSQDQQKSAYDTVVHIKQSLSESLKKTKEIDKINELTESILAISEQTNLLALNAQIEAARAGESGKGFTVVANEVRKLAESSEETVSEIQKIVSTTLVTVNNLVNASKETLNYIETDVLNSYKESVMVGESYNTDANYINDLVTDLSATAQEVLASIKTVSSSISDISKASNEGAEGTTNVAGSVSDINKRAGKIKLEMEHINNCSEDLKNLVKRFVV